MEEKRTITITLDKAKEWYNSDNPTLQEVALQAFSKEEFEPFDYTKVKSFEDAKEALGLSGIEWSLLDNTLDDLKSLSKTSAAMFQLHIIRRALNKGYDLHLTTNAEGQKCTWVPCLRFITESCNYYNKELKNGEMKKICKIRGEGKVYLVLAGSADSCRSGLGFYRSYCDVGYVNAHVGLFGCATEEIAQHFGLHFGMLIMEAMYGNIVDFKIIDAE